MKFLLLILLIVCLFNIIFGQEIEIIDISVVENYPKNNNASYGYWDNREKFHFY